MIYHQCSVKRASAVMTVFLCCFCVNNISIDAFQLPIHNTIQKITPFVSNQRHDTPSSQRTVLLMTVPLKDVNGNNIENISNEASRKDTTNLASGNIVTSVNIQKASYVQPNKRTLPSNWLGEKGYILSTAALIGLTTGTNIAVFKKAVECVREILYGDGLELPPWMFQFFGGSAYSDEHFLRLSENLPVALAPAVGGLLVGILLKVGGDLPPGLRDTVTEGKCEFLFLLT